MSALQRGRREVRRLAGSVPVRAWQRYSTGRGSVLAGGMAYFAFFSLLPALAVGFTVFGLVLGGDRDLQARLVTYVNGSLGTTVISTASARGLVSVDDLIQNSVLGLTGIIGGVTLLLAGLGWLDGIREGIRAMFGRPRYAGNVVITKLRDLAVLAVLGGLVMMSVVVAFLVNTLTARVLNWVGLSGSTAGTVLVKVIGALVVLVLDTAVILVLIRLLGAIRAPMADLAAGAWVGAVGLGLLKIFGGVLLGRTGGGNRLLAVFGVAVGLLIWMNLVSRVVLLAASWSATVAGDRGHLVAEDAEPEPEPAPAPAPAREPARPAALHEPVAPSYGQRAGDRTVVAAGVVLGATGAVATRVAAGGVRSLIDAVRGRRRAPG